jgi:hypothetical protein
LHIKREDKMIRALKFAIGLFSLIIGNTLLFGLVVAGLTEIRGFEYAFYITFGLVICEMVGLYLLLTNRPEKEN